MHVAKKGSCTAREHTSRERKESYQDSRKKVVQRDEENRHIARQ